MTIELVKSAPVGRPEWVDRHQFTVKDGRDPLGLETITTDRIVPLLVPGIVALSDQARYVSVLLPHPATGTGPCRSERYPDG